MIRRPPRSTLDRSSAASDVYKRQVLAVLKMAETDHLPINIINARFIKPIDKDMLERMSDKPIIAVSYTHLRAHETVLDLVCRLLLEKTKKKKKKKKKKRKKKTKKQLQVHRVQEQQVRNIDSQSSSLSH